MEILVDATIRLRSLAAFHDDSIFHDIYDVLNEHHTVRVGRPPGKIQNCYRKILDELPVIHEILSEKTKLLVTWWTKKTGTWNFNIPRAVLFRGILPSTHLLDTGLLSESMLIHVLPNALEPYFDEKYQQWSSRYCKHIIKTNQSARIQPPIANLNLPPNFVFLPMQYSKDFSIQRHCSMPYFSFVAQVAKFCASNSLSLVIKYHPDIQHNKPSNHKNTWRSEELNKLGKLVKKCRKMGCKISVMDGSVHRFLQNCKFMVGMNTMTHIDAIMNGCISFHCGNSPFMNSGAVIHDEDVQHGLNRCLNITPADTDRITKTQKALIYYLYHRYSLLSPSPKFSSEYTNKEKIGFFFDWMLSDIVA